MEDLFIVTFLYMIQIIITTYVAFTETSGDPEERTLCSVTYVYLHMRNCIRRYRGPEQVGVCSLYFKALVSNLGRDTLCLECSFPGYSQSLPGTLR